MGRSPQSCGCQPGRVQRLIVNGRYHARGPRGAKGSGGPPGERNGQYRHGERTKAAIAEQRKFSALLKMLRAGLTFAREARQREALATARAANANLSAIDYLLQVLRDPTTPPGRRTEVAKFVAPYLEYRVRVSRSRRGQAKSET